MHVCVHVCMHPPRPEEGTGLLEPPDVVTELGALQQVLRPVIFAYELCSDPQTRLSVSFLSESLFPL